MTCQTQKVIELVPPDGGWGWIMLLGVAVNNIFNMSMISLFGLLYGDALEAMGYRTQGTALVLYTIFFVSIFTGPMTGAMIKLTSPRVVAVTGACICTVAIFLSGFSTNIWHLVITYGVLLGLGLDFLAISSFVAIYSYFSLKKNRAVGLALVGTSVGQTLMPHLVRYLLENYGFRGTCLILSSLSFHGVAGCMLMRPVEFYMKRVEREEPKEITIDIPHAEISQTNSDMQENHEQLLKPYVVNENGIHANDKLLVKADINVSKVNQLKSDQKKKKPSLLSKLDDLFGLPMLCNLRFINIIMGIALSTTSVTNFSMLYPFFLEKEASLNKQQIANCMSSVALADLIGRFILPIFQDKCKIKGRWILIMTCIWMIFTRQVLAFQTNLKVLLAMSFLYGFGRSMVVVQRNIVVSENCELVQVPVAVGLGKFSTGLVALPLGWFLGWIRDYTGSYVACLTAQNALLVVVLLTWIPDMLYIYYIKENK